MSIRFKAFVRTPTLSAHSRSRSRRICDRVHDVDTLQEMICEYKIFDVLRIGKVSLVSYKHETFQPNNKYCNYFPKALSRKSYFRYKLSKLCEKGR